MASNHDRIVLDVARDSRLMQAGRLTTAALQRAWTDSRGAVLAASAHRRLAHLGTTERVRLLGVLLLTATIVHALLVQWSPPVARPSFAGVFHVLSATAALLFLTMSAAIGGAWPTSRLRRLLFPRHERSTGLRSQAP